MDRTRFVERDHGSSARQGDEFLFRRKTCPTFTLKEMEHRSVCRCRVAINSPDTMINKRLRCFPEQQPREAAPAVARDDTHMVDRSLVETIARATVEGDGQDESSRCIAIPEQLPPFGEVAVALWWREDSLSGTPRAKHFDSLSVRRIHRVGQDRPDKLRQIGKVDCSLPGDEGWVRVAAHRPLAGPLERNLQVRARRVRRSFSSHEATR